VTKYYIYYYQLKKMQLM